MLEFLTGSGAPMLAATAAEVARDDIKNTGGVNERSIFVALRWNLQLVPFYQTIAFANSQNAFYILPHRDSIRHL